MERRLKRTIGKRDDTNRRDEPWNKCFRQTRDERCNTNTKEDESRNSMKLIESLIEEKVLELLSNAPRLFNEMPNKNNIRIKAKRKEGRDEPIRC